LGNRITVNEGLYHSDIDNVLEWCDNAPKERIERYAFKSSEWLSLVTKEVLIKELENYKKEVGTYPRSLREIHYFLHLNIYLYPDPEPRKHHIRCVATILFDNEVT